MAAIGASPMLDSAPMDRAQLAALALDAITEMVSVIGEDGLYRLVNAAWCHTFGRRAEEVLGRSPMDLFGMGPDHPRMRAVHECLRTGQPVHMRAPHQLAHLQGRLFEATYAPHADDPAGVRCVVVVTRDVTEAQRQSDAVRQGAEAVQAAQATTRALLDGFPGLISMLDHGLHYTFVNDAMLRMLDRPREAIVGQSVEEVLGPERGQVLRRQILALPPDEALMYERQVGERTIHVTVARTTDRLTGAAVFHGFGIDITAMKRAELALIAARDTAEQANQAKSQFLSHMSHELRTPLNAILGFAQLLSEDPQLPAPARAQVGDILRGARHLLRLINDALDLGSVEAGRLPLEVGPVPLDPLVRQAVGLIEPLARERGVALRVNTERMLERMTVQADATRLQQVLLNLLGNATKYTPRGGVVTLRVEARRGTARLAVTDTGPGLSPAQQQRLFTPFERVLPQMQHVEGSGIGLALSRRLMEAMGGDIGVISHLGQGSTFWLELPTVRTARSRAGEPLPAAAPVEAQADAAIAAGHPAAAPADPPVHRVLYVEDNEVNILLMEAMLRRLPQVTLDSARDVPSGWQAATQHPPDLILMDLQLPGGSGLELMQRLAEDERTRHVPVIAVTANAMESDVAAGRQAGFVDYITKPVELNRLLAAVQAALPGLEPPSH